ncbi:hypothetical protein T484DRAFT_1825604 [Baffinella frigidus]|nr:hypothetical protein T484DRAFT_1825604 [Cryptophyta sp. CCMP2293]
MGGTYSLLGPHDRFMVDSGAPLTAEVFYSNWMGVQKPVDNVTAWIYLHLFDNPKAGKWVQRRQLFPGESGLVFDSSVLRVGEWYCFKMCTSNHWWRRTIAVSPVFLATDFDSVMHNLAHRTAAASTSAVVRASHPPSQSTFLKQVSTLSRGAGGNSMAQHQTHLHVPLPAPSIPAGRRPSLDGIDDGGGDASRAPPRPSEHHRAEAGRRDWAEGVFERYEKLLLERNQELKPIAR